MRGSIRKHGSTYTPLGPRTIGQPFGLTDRTDQGRPFQRVIQLASREIAARRRDHHGLRHPLWSTPLKQNCRCRLPPTRRLVKAWTPAAPRCSGRCYDRYVAHGGDFGAVISRQLGLAHPENVVALHLTSILSASATPENADLSVEAEKRSVEAGQPL